MDSYARELQSTQCSLSELSPRLPVWSRLFACLVAALVCLAAPCELKAQNGKGKTPKIVIDGDGSHLTPFAKGLGQTIGDKIKKNGCGADHNPKKSERGLAQQCGVPAVDVTNSSTGDCPDCGATSGTVNVPDSQGNMMQRSGLQLKNKVSLQYDSPTQRGLSAWPTPRFNGNRTPSSIETHNPTPQDDDPMHLSGVSSANVNKENVDSSITNNCSHFGAAQGLPDGLGDPQPDGSCDVSRALVVKANMMAGKATDPQGNKKHNKAFDADDTGHCADPSTPLSGDAAVKCGQDARQQNLTETFTAFCKPDFQYVDGQCLKPETPAAAALLSTLVQNSASGPLPLVTGTKAIDKKAMMGFTFAPPEIKWGFDYEEDVCIDLVFTSFCITVFAARIGYDFDVAAGLRLPVNLHIDSIPDPSILAGSNATIKPQLTPVDFSAGDYKQFCLDNGMADGVIIADCDRFSFPEFLSSELAILFPADVNVDGKELVAQAKVFAGVEVVVVDVPIIQVGIDAGADFSTMCTLLQLKDSKLVGDLLNFGADLAVGTSLLDTVKSQNLNCSSFTTPFGSQASVIPGGLPSPLVFPFLKTFHIDADCVKATLEGQTVTVNHKERPMCTGMELKYDGASLGLGIDVQLSAGSSLIQADWSDSGDADPSSGATLSFLAPPGQLDITNPDLGPVHFDNFDNNTDSATITLNNFTYFLDTLTVALNANVEFGGILSFLPDVGSIPVFQFSIDTGTLGIPLPQHNGSKPVDFSVFVTNYALSINGSPDPGNDPKLIVDGKTLKIKPGESGAFDVQVTNQGSVTGDFDNFGRVLPDTDPQFNLPPGWTSTPDAGGFQGQAVLGIPAHSPGSVVETISISPLRHPLTRPGKFPVVFSADSRQARQLGMDPTDPTGHARTHATDTVFVQILPFYDPRITLTPGSASGKPGAPAASYTLQGQIFGNVTDTEQLANSFINFNSAGCTLTTLGSSSGCPFRAVPTILQNLWTTIGSLPAQFGPLQPLGTAQAGFTITIPPDWAGMQDTTYDALFTATSTADPAVPPAKNSLTLHYTVVATKQSMARYAGLELDDLVLQLQNAEAAGLKTGGGLPILVHDVQPKHAKSLGSILVGDLAGANGTLATEVKGMQAFLHAINGPAIPVALLADWTARANAIIADLNTTQASMITSQ